MQLIKLLLRVFTIKMMRKWQPGHETLTYGGTVNFGLIRKK